MDIALRNGCGRLQTSGTPLIRNAWDPSEVSLVWRSNNNDYYAVINALNREVPL